MAGRAAVAAALLLIVLMAQGADAQAAQPGDSCNANSDCMNSDPAPSPPLCCSTLTSAEGEAVCVASMFNALGQQQCLCPAFDYEGAQAYGCNSTTGATTKQHCCRGFDVDNPDRYPTSGLCVNAPELCTCYTTAADCPKGPKKTCCAKPEDGQDDGLPGICSAAANRPDGTYCTYQSANANGVTCGTATNAFNAQYSPDRYCKGDRCPPGGAGCPCRTVDDCRSTTTDCCTFSPITGTGLCATNAFTSVASGSKQQCLDCNLFSQVNNKQKCPAGTSCCPNGQCRAAGKCGCATDFDCPSGSCCRSDTRTCSSTTVNATTGVQLCGDCNSFPDRNLACPASAAVCCKRGNCAASISKCGCRYTSECPWGYVCNRDKASAALGTCTNSLFNGTKQVGGDCTEAAANGVSCPAAKPTCCKVGGTCQTSVAKCPKQQLCGYYRNFTTGEALYYGGCPWQQCCAWNNTCVKSAQACPNCNDANGASCPLTAPVCCPRGACVKTVAQCEAVSIAGFNVAKYQRFHRQVVDLIATSTFAGDNSVFGYWRDDNSRGDYPKPDWSDYSDFRSYVEPGVQRVYCADRYNWNWNQARGDPSQTVHLNDDVTNVDPTGAQQPFEGLDATSAAAALEALTAAAAVAWRDECAAYPPCATVMAQEGATLATFQAFTNATAAKILAYLKQAPGNRNLLCGPRDYFGPVFSAFWRSPDSWDQYFGAVAWPWYLRPLTVPIARADNVNETLSASTLLSSAIEARWYLPEQVLAYEGIIALLINHDHALIALPGVVTLGGAAKQATLTSPSPTLTTAATKKAAATKSKATAAGGGRRHRHRIAEGPTASEAYRRAGFVAGVKRASKVAAPSPAARANSAAAPPGARAPAFSSVAAAAAAATADGSATVSTSAALATCAVSDAACIVSAMREATSSPAGGSSGGGAASNAVAAAAKASSAAPRARAQHYDSGNSQQECLTALRNQLENLKAAQELCTTVKRDADAALMGSATGQPKTLLQLQVKQVAATLQLVCPGLAKYPDPAAYHRTACSKALKIYSNRLSAMAAAVAPIACGADVPATSASAGNMFAATPAAWNLVRNPAGLRATSCIDVGASLLADAGCALLQPLIDKYTTAYPCCQNVCAGSAACVALAEGWVSNAYVGECAAGTSGLAWPPGFAAPGGAPWGA